MAILLFFLPGMLVLRSGYFNKKGLSEVLCLVVALSISYFAALSLLLRFAGLSVTGSIYLTFIFSLMLIIAGRLDLSFHRIAASRNELMIILVFIILTLARLAPMMLQPLPAGTDIAKSAYAVRQIFERDGMNGTGSGGFEMISAAFVLIGGAEPQSAVFFTACFSFALIMFALYIALSSFYPNKIAAASSTLAVFLFPWPQNMFSADGSAAVFYISFLLIFLAVALDPKLKSVADRLTVGLIPFLAFLSGISAVINLKALLLLLLVPLAIVIAAVLKNLGRFKLVRAALFLVALVSYFSFYLYASIAGCPVSASDLEAFSWIDNTVGRSSVFLVNGNDAGIWIPAMTGRAVIARDSARKASYIYIGDKAGPDADFRSRRLESRPFMFKRVYLNGSSQVWKML
jgi:hypothetical protein